MKFECVADGIYLLKIPFNGIWAGVYLVRGEALTLIDSGLDAEGVDGAILPALRKFGAAPSDLDLLLCTHTHGDHIGGHARLKELAPRLRVAATALQREKLADPLACNIAIRRTFPEDSPPPSRHLRGVAVQLCLREGDCADRLCVIPTSGHDDDAVCFFDGRTGTLLTGDSLQQDGTDTQGVGLYMYLDDYRASIRRLMALDAARIVCGHPFRPLGAVAEGKEACKRYLSFCLELTDIYQEEVERFSKEGKTPRACAEALIRARGGKMPEHLFLARYTVREHLKKIQGEV